MEEYKFQKLRVYQMALDHGHDVLRVADVDPQNGRFPDLAVGLAGTPHYHHH